MIPSEAELEYLRSQPHRTRLYLSIYKPSVVLSGVITDPTATKRSMKMTYSVITGSYTSVKNGQTLFLGSTINSRDLGKIRIRSATSSTIDVAENAHINWASGTYFQVVDFFEIYPVYYTGEIIEEDVVFYKDTDIAYTNQNRILGTFPCAGSHEAVFIEPSTGKARVYYSATGTYNVLGDGLTYAWNFGGADTASSTSETPGWIEYSTAGHYTTSLSVTSTSGAIDTTYRHVSVYERFGYGSNNPIRGFSLESLVGDRNGGGWKASLSIRLDEINSVDEGALVVLFADDWYGGTKVSIGGNHPNKGHIVFTGYVDEGSVIYDYAKSEVKLTASSPTSVMEKSEALSLNLTSSLSPRNWAEVYDMTVMRAIYHYLRWNTTVLNCTDVVFNSTDYFIQYFTSDKSNIFNALEDFVMNSIYGSVVSDRHGRIYIEAEPPNQADAGKNLPVQFDLDRMDWMDEIEMEESIYRSVSYVEAGGMQYAGGGASSSTPLLSGAPGAYLPAYFGGELQHQGLALQNQSHLNDLTGNIFSWLNVKFPKISVTLTGNYRNFDIAPLQLVNVTVDDTQNNFGIVWTSEPTTVLTVSHSHDGNINWMGTKVVLRQLLGLDIVGETIEFPDDPVTEEPQNPGDPTTGSSYITVLSSTYDATAYITYNLFSASSPSWRGLGGLGVPYSGDNLRAGVMIDGFSNSVYTKNYGQYYTTLSKALDVSPVAADNLRAYYTEAWEYYYDYSGGLYHKYDIKHIKPIYIPSRSLGDGYILYYKQTTYSTSVGAPPSEYQLVSGLSTSDTLKKQYLSQMKIVRAISHSLMIDNSLYLPKYTNYYQAILDYPTMPRLIETDTILTNLFTLANDSTDGLVLCAPDFSTYVTGSSLVGAFHQKVWFSNDGGHNWLETYDIGEGSSDEYFLTSSKNRNRFYLIRPSTLKMYVFDELGNYEDVKDLPANADVIGTSHVRSELSRIDVNRDGSIIIVAGNDDKVYVSTDEGDNWTGYDTPTTLTRIGCVSIAEEGLSFLGYAITKVGDAGLTYVYTSTSQTPTSWENKTGNLNTTSSNEAVGMAMVHWRERKL